MSWGGATTTVRSIQIDLESYCKAPEYIYSFSDPRLPITTDSSSFPNPSQPRHTSVRGLRLYRFKVSRGLENYPKGFKIGDKHVCNIYFHLGLLRLLRPSSKLTGRYILMKKLLRQVVYHLMTQSI